MRLSVISPSLFRLAFSLRRPSAHARGVVAVKHAGALHATPVPMDCLPLPTTATKVHTFSSITLARTSSSISRQM
jgi:hypothetical protein